MSVHLISPPTQLEPMTLSAPADRILLSFIIVFYALIYIFSGIVIDTARDLINAYFITAGISYPLQGPVLSGAIHLGPLWFYLLAVPIFLFHSFSMTAFFVGLISGTKFILAYLCGRRLLDHSFGLLWAIALTLPGWSSFEQVTYSHTNMVATTSLAVLYCCIRLLQDNDLRWLAAAGLCFSLALHAHPTTISLGVVLIITYVYLIYRDKRLRPAYPILAGILFILPFLPYLFSQWSLGWPEFSSTSGYLHSEIRAQNLKNWPAIIQGAFITGPEVVLRHLINGDDLIKSVWRVTLGLLWGGTLIGLIIAFVKRRTRILVIIGVASLLLVTGTIAVIRPFTPFYMTYVVYPFSAALMGLGLYGLTTIRHGISATIVGLMCVVILGQFIAVGIALQRLSQHVTFTLPGPALADIKNYSRAMAEPNMLISMTTSDAIGRYLCSHSQAKVVHGDLAYLADNTLGLGELLHCHRGGQTSIIGASPGQPQLHLAGLVAPTWPLQAAPDHRVGPLAILTPTTIINPSAGHPMPDGRQYPPHGNIGDHPAQEYTWSFTTPTGTAVVISNPIPFYLTIEIKSVTANGQPLSLMTKTLISQIYACNSCDQNKDISWQVTVSTPLREWLDIFTLR